MKFKNISILKDNISNYNLNSVDLDGRFRNPQNYFLNYVNAEKKFKNTTFKEGKKLKTNMVYEIGTQQGPYWWLGDLNEDYPNLTNMFDLIKQVQPKLFKLTEQKKAIIHIDQSLEGFPLYESKSKRDFFKSIHSKLTEYSINPNQIFYSTSNLIETQKYNSWCVSNNITEKIKIISQPFFAEMSRGNHFYHTNYESSVVNFNEHINYKTQNQIKTFSCLNRVLRPHRIALLKMLNYYGLIDNSDTSFDKFTIDYNPNDYPYHDAYNKENFSNLDAKLPLVIDQTDFSINQAQNFLKITYLRSWYSVITETYFQDFYKDSVFLSEKIFKPIRAMHPFVIVCQPNSLSLLRNMGFKTFSEFWDESYDLIKNPTDRLEAICKLIDQLNKKTTKEWLNIYHDMQHILEHNYNTLVNTTWIDYKSSTRGMFK